MSDTMEGSKSSVVKNRSSSGCLVIKKKPVSGAGAGSSGARKVYESKKEKKGGRLSAGDSVSNEEEFLDCYPRRDVARISGSLGYDDFEDVGFAQNGLIREGGVKRREIDVYDFDEYDDLSDVDMLGARYIYDRGGSGGERRFYSPMMAAKGGAGGVGFESGSSNGDIIYKRRNSFHGGKSSERIASGGFFPGKRRFEGNSEFPASSGRQFGGSDDAIRLQGRNGVLKVRVKNKSEKGEQQPQGYRPLEGNNVVRRCQELTAKSLVIQRHSPHTVKQLPKKAATFGSVRINHGKKRKSFAAKSSDESNEESEDSGPSPKLQPDNAEVRRPGKRGRKPANLQSPGTYQPIKMRQGKVKRGSGTEKQLLREKIKSMLMNAGWTIDYRPRRGRDYSDAVYVNPMGTAYWSIIKAYDALQKQLEEEGKTVNTVDDDCSFRPITDDILSKLTRQTRQKIEKELKRKKREEGGAKKKRGRPSRTCEEDESDTDSCGSGRPDEKLSSYVKRNVKSLKGSLKDVSSSNSQMRDSGEKSSSLCSSRFVHARRSRKIGRCTLLVRHSEKWLDSESDGFVPYTGRRNLLSWLIDSGTVNLSEKVQYMNRRRTHIMLEGWITKEGIHCACCSKILSVNKFEIHTGSKLRQPFQNIYLSSGASLLQCQVDAWNKQDEPLRNGFNKLDVEGDDPNDDTCAICGDGGDLMCCDSCPSTYHQSCLDIKMLPPGDWHCPHCSCKFCGLAEISLAEGNDALQDKLLRCSLCEGKFHYSCMKMGSSAANCDGHHFCRRICQELFERLQKLLGVKYELEGGLCWSLIHRMDLASDESAKSFPQKVEWNSKLAVAQTIMDECFLPITDRRSGINMIHSVLYNCGSNFTRLNYSEFYTAVLERGDEIVSAASIRIHGTKFAEMPFIGTRHIYRRQGMCRQLLFAIELALRSLKVEKLVIPAISELMDTWTKVFGFEPLEESDKQEMKIMNMLVFPGTDMLQKNLFGQDSMKRGLAGLDAFQAGNNLSDVPNLSKHFDSSPEPLTDALEDRKMNDKSTTDGSSKAMRDSVTKTIFLNTDPMYVCDEIKLPCHGACTDVSTDAMPIVLGKESQGNTSPALLLNVKTNESDGDPNHHVLPEASVLMYVSALGIADVKTEVAADCQLTKETGNVDSDLGCTMACDPLAVRVERQGIRSPSLQLHVNSNEANDDLKHHVPPNASVQNFVNALNNAGGEHQIAADCLFTEETGNVDPDPRCAMACDVFAGNEEMRGTTDPTLQLIVKENEADDDLKDHVPPDACVQIFTNALNNADGEHQVAADFTSTEETDNVDPDPGHAMSCDMLAGNEEMRGTTSPALQLIYKKNEADDDSKDHVPADASAQIFVNALGEKPEVAADCQSTKGMGNVYSDLVCAVACDFFARSEERQGTTSPTLHLKVKTKEFGDDLKEHVTPNATAQIGVNTLGNGDGKLEIAADCQLTKVSGNVDSDVGCATTCDVLAGGEDRLRTIGPTLQLMKTDSDYEFRDDAPTNGVGMYVNALDNGNEGPEIANDSLLSKETGSDTGCAITMACGSGVMKGQGDCSLACKTRPAADTSIRCLFTDNKLVDAVHNGLSADHNVLGDYSSASKTVYDADDKVVMTVDSGLPGNINNVHDDCSVASKGVLAADAGQASLSEASTADNGRDYKEVKVDDIRVAFNQDAKWCSESQSLHVTNLVAQGASREQNHFSGADAVCSKTPELLARLDGDGSCGSPLNGSIGVQKQLPASSRFSCQPTLEDGVLQLKDVETMNVQSVSHVPSEVSTHDADVSPHISNACINKG